MEKFAKCLDPNDLGKVSFKDFCHGVLAMKGRHIGIVMVCSESLEKVHGDMKCGDLVMCVHVSLFQTLSRSPPGS